MAATMASSTPVAPRMRVRDYFTINIYWFAISYLWNSLGPILLPTLVTQLVPETQKGSALGLVSALGLILAVIVQPLAGTLSDHRTTRWGKRRPFIVGGTLGDVIFLLALAFAPTYPWLLVSYLLLQISSNIAHGPYQSYIPGLVPERKRGAVTGVKQFIEIAGIVVTSLATGYLVGQGQIVLAFIVIIAMLLLTMAITALFVSEVPFEGMPPQAEVTATRTDEFDFRFAVRALFYSRDFGLWLISRLLILIGAGLVRNYALFFFHDVLRLSNPAAEVGNLLAVIAVAIALVSYPAGYLSDRWGRKGFVIASGILGAIGSLLMMNAVTLTQVLIYGGIIGISIGIFLSANWAWATDLVPAESSGRYLGISNLATAGSGVLAGFGGVALDYFNAQAPNSGYTILYLGAAICYVLGTLVVLSIPDRKRSGKN